MKKAIVENLYQHVDFLTSIFPRRNYKNLESLEKAVVYITDELNKIGLPSHQQHWEAEGNTYKNILVSFHPSLSKRFIIGAHYDVYKNVPGADDNASSVAVLLEIARILSLAQWDKDFGVDLVFYSLEEPPFFKKKTMGSYIHAQSVYEKGQNVIGMIALEMLGYFEGPHKALIVSGIKKYDDFNRRISNLLKTRELLDSSKISFADDYRNNGPSDHRNYWPFGYPAAMVIGTGGQKNPHYHQESDRIETLDFDTMAKVTDSLIYTLLNF